MRKVFAEINLKKSRLHALVLSLIHDSCPFAYSCPAAEQATAAPRPYSVASSSYRTAMSAVPSLFVFGLAWAFGAVAYTIPSATNLIEIPIINQSLCLQLTFAPSDQNLMRRLDYTYTQGIGAHKVHTTSHTWNAAWRICRNEGGHLAIINSYAESRLISQLLEEAGPHVSGHLHSHIGFHALFQKNEWVTIFDQSLVEAGFIEWDVNEPSNLNNNERCGSVHKNGKLNDINCDSLCGFVCELPYI